MAKKEVRHNWRRFFLLLLLVVFVIIILLNFAQFGKIGLLLKQVNILFLVLALIAQYFVFQFIGFWFWNVLTKLKERLNPFYLVKTALAMFFVEWAVPSFSASGGALLFYSLRKRRIEKAKSSILVILNVFLNNIVFFIFLLSGLLYLLLAKEAVTARIITIAILVFILLVLLTRIIWVKSARRRFKKFISFILKKLPKPRKRTLSFLEQLYSSIDKAKLRGSKLVIPFLFVIIAFVFKLIALYFVFISFNYGISLGILVIGFVLTTFISSVSYIRIGVYETSMALIYTGFGVPFELAVAVMLIFRLISFWLPMLAGFFCYRDLMRK